MLDLARLDIPIASLYDRFSYHLFPAKEVTEISTSSNPGKDLPSHEQDKMERLQGSFENKPTLRHPMTQDKENQEKMLWHKEPRLMHRNKDYTREAVIK